MVRRLLLLGLVVFVIVPGLLLTLEHIRGRQQFEAAIAELNQRGEIVDLGRLMPPAVPARSNGLAALLLAGGRLARGNPAAPTAFTIVAPGRAIPGLALDHWPGQQEKTNTWKDVQAWVTENAGDLDELRLALELPFRQPTLDWQMGSRMLLPHLARQKSVVNSLSLAALDAAHRGDLDAAVADLRALRRIEDDLETEPILISQLVRVACAAIANSRLWSIVEGREWTEPQLALLQQALAPSSLGAGMLRGLAGERALILHELRRMPVSELIQAQDLTAQLGAPNGPPDLKVPDSMDEAVSLAGDFTRSFAQGIATKVVFPLWQFAWGDQAIVHYLHAMDELLRVDGDAVRARSLAATKSFDLEHWTRPTDPLGRLRSVYASMLVGTLERGLAKALRGETERDLLVTGIALRRFHRRHGHYPEKLDALVPELLPAIPVDRMDGKPLRYRPETDGGFTLWSVGDNLIDDQGDATSPDGGLPHPHWWNARDAVWPQCASEEQVLTWRAAEEKKAARRKGGGSVSGPMQMSAELMKRYGLVPPPPPPATNASPAGTPP